MTCKEMIDVINDLAGDYGLVVGKSARDGDTFHCYIETPPVGGEKIQAQLSCGVDWEKVVVLAAMRQVVRQILRLYRQDLQATLVGEDDSLDYAGQ